ncbi:MAG: hypothetical protein ACLRXQ_08855 [Phascolarctobacterium faecium]
MAELDAGSWQRILRKIIKKGVFTQKLRKKKKDEMLAGILLLIAN